MTVFTMFFIELMAARFDVFGKQAHDLEATDPSLALFRHGEKYDANLNKGTKSFIMLPLVLAQTWILI